MIGINGLQHIGLPVNNSKETVCFYSKLGFTPIYETKNGNEKVVFLKMGNLVIETYENKMASLIDGAWNHVALDVIDIDETWTYIVETLHLQPIEGSIQYLPFWDKGVKFFTIYGPSKERIEFSQML